MVPNYYIEPVGEKSMRASPLRNYGENKWLLNFKWLPNEENETWFT